MVSFDLYNLSGMDTSLFTAREPQARAILNAVNKHHHVLVTVRSGIGKTALLEFVAPVLEARTLTQLEAPSQFTAKTASLERRVQEANLTVKGARAAKGVILEKQWLRSPLAGLVSDVRVKSVTGKGVSVEVVILEERSKPERCCFGIKKERLGSRN